MNEVKLLLAAALAVSGPGMVTLYFMKDYNIAIPLGWAINIVFWLTMIIIH